MNEILENEYNGVHVRVVVQSPSHALLLATAWTLALEACLYLTASPSLAIRGIRVDCIMDLMQSALKPKENFLG